MIIELSKLIDLKGQTYGKLTALKHIGFNFRREAMWLCKCSCGNTKEASGYELRKGKLKSCGCAKIKPIIDLTGQKFGRLYVLKQAGRDLRGQINWLCKCVCGSETIVLGSSLRGGLTKSCGCLSRDGKDLKGMVFKHLTVLRKATDEEKGNRRTKGLFWVLLCDCGRETIAAASHLKSGAVTTCQKCHYGKYEIIGEIAVGRFKNGFEFIIDKVDLECVQKHQWWNCKGYPETRIDGKGVKLHNFLIKVEPGFNVDHIDRDRRNNCRSNLRVCTNKENSYNKSLRCDSRTGYMGVSYISTRRYYAAYITHNGKRFYGGQFQSSVEAAKARDNLAKKFFGEFANLNFKHLG